MKDYYKRRAQEYEQIYHRQDALRRNEQEEIAKAMQEFLKGRDSIEIACGTGYWTKFLSNTAKSIVATDAVKEVIEIAKRKEYSIPVEFEVQDAYELKFAGQNFDGGLAMFWLSHIPKAKMEAFINGFHRALKKGAKVFMADNVYVEGIGGELIRKNGEEDTYKSRQLGSSQELVLKNYYSKDELDEIFGNHSTSLKVHYGKCFWYVSYEMAAHNN